MRSDSRRLDAIVFGTLVDLIETLKFVKSSRSISSTNSTAAVTSASTGFSRSSPCRCLGSEPELTPMRIGVPWRLASSATSATFSGPPMLPGFRRTQWAPASIALSASVWLKWMSAITGIGDSLTIILSASTSLSRGTATRTMSAPASATVRIWSIVAWRLAVSVLGIVWTATGAPPPIGTPPTWICRCEAIRVSVGVAASISAGRNGRWARARGGVDMRRSQSGVMARQVKRPRGGVEEGHGHGARRGGSVGSARECRRGRQRRRRELSGDAEWDGLLQSRRDVPGRAGCLRLQPDGAGEHVRVQQPGRDGPSRLHARRHRLLAARRIAGRAGLRRRRPAPGVVAAEWSRDPDDLSDRAIRFHVGVRGGDVVERERAVDVGLHPALLHHVDDLLQLVDPLRPADRGAVEGGQLDGRGDLLERLEALDDPFAPEQPGGADDAARHGRLQRVAHGGAADEV